MEPLIYTARGNIPCKDLRINPVWEFADTYIKLTVQYYLGDEMVRNDAYVYDKIGLGAQAIANPMR
jgi:hypothetical protein